MGCFRWLVSMPMVLVGRMSLYSSVPLYLFPSLFPFVPLFLYYSRSILIYSCYLLSPSLSSTLTINPTWLTNQPTGTTTSPTPGRQWTRWPLEQNSNHWRVPMATSGPLLRMARSGVALSSFNPPLSLPLSISLSSLCWLFLPLWIICHLFVGDYEGCCSVEIYHFSI